METQFVPPPPSPRRGAQLYDSGSALTLRQTLPRQTLQPKSDPDADSQVVCPGGAQEPNRSLVGPTPYPLPPTPLPLSPAPSPP